VKSSPLLPRHRERGAQVSDSAPPFVLAFDEVPGEYRAAAERAVVFDHSDRELVVVAGADSASFLHRLLANSVRGLGAWEGNRNLLLTGKGKVQFDFDLAVEPDAIRLSVRSGSGAGLLRALDTYHFAEKLTLTDASDSHAPLSLCGPDAAAVVERALAVAAPREDHRTVLAEFRGAPLRVTALPVAGSSGWRIDAGPRRLEELWDALIAAGARAAGRITYDILRVEAGAAEPGVDVDDTVYPQEARLESAFSLDKGCYVGQEVVAKIDTYGGLNKRLVALAVSHDDPVPHGTRLFREDDGEWRDLGVVTSWAYSFVLDTGLVLAYVKRRHQSPGTTFRLVAPGAAAPDSALGDAKIVPLPVREGALAPTGAFE
jgi:folate-binding protein YgfZ